MRHEERRVGTDAVLRPRGECLADVRLATAVVVGDDGCDALHEVRQIGSRASVGIAEIALRVRVGIDEAGRDDETANVDGALWCQVGLRRVADEDDAIAAHSDIRDARRRARPVEQRAAAEEEIDVLSWRARSDAEDEGRES